VTAGAGCNALFGVDELGYGGGGSAGGQGGGSSTAGSGGTSTWTTSSSSGGAGAGGMGGTGGSCAADPCEVLPPQCGCAAEENCTVVSGARQCVAAGSAQAGERCDGGEVCDRGLYCGGAETFRLCFPFCDSDVDCKSPGGRCIHPSDGQGGTIDEMVCTQSCLLTTGGGCPAAGSKCTAAYDAQWGGWYTGCVEAGSGTAGASCTDDTDCASGWGCTMNGNQGTCLRMCVVGGGGICNNGETCNSFGVPLVIGGTEYGGCS